MSETRMIKLLLTCFLIMSSVAALADQLLEVRTISRVFAEGTSTAGFYTIEGLSQCKYGIMYIDMANSNGVAKQSGSAQLSMVLAAKAAQWKIVRMDYLISSNGTCRLGGLHIE